MLLVAALIAVSSAATAQVWRAENWLLVAPLGQGNFEVIEDMGKGPRGIWCAAGSFAFHAMGLPRDARLYIETPRGPSVSGVGRIGVGFTADPSGLTPSTSYSLSTRVRGLSLPVHHAMQFCRDWEYEIE